MSEKTTLQIEGMSCGHCVNAVEGIILAMDGIRSVLVNLGNHTAEVTYHPEATNVQEIIKNINSSEIYKATEK